MSSHGLGWPPALTPERLRQRQYIMDWYMGMQLMMMDHMLQHQRWTSELLARCPTEVAPMQRPGPRRCALRFVHSMAMSMMDVGVVRVLVRQHFMAVRMRMRLVAHP